MFDNQSMQWLNELSHTCSRHDGVIVGTCVPIMLKETNGHECNDVTQQSSLPELMIWCKYKVV